jgi:hypothetical protein
VAHTPTAFVLHAGERGPYGFVVQEPPVQPQSAAPLQVTVHPPATQPVIVQVCAPWQVSWQSPPAQSIVHEPPVQSWTQSPWVHCGIVHIALVQVCEQSLWRQVIEHEPPVHCWLQPPCAHCIEHEALSQVCVQSLSAQVPAHVEPEGHMYWQSLRSPEQVSEQDVSAGQVQDSPLASGHENPVVPPSAATPEVVVLLLHAPTIRRNVTRPTLLNMTET